MLRHARACILVLSCLSLVSGTKPEAIDDAPMVAALSGHSTVVQFFASWCTSCSGVTREVQAILKQAPSSTRYLLVSLDESATQAAIGAHEQELLGVPRASIRYDRNRTLATAVGVSAVPTVVILDPTGHVVTRLEGHFGAAQRGELLDRLSRVSTSLSKGVP